ncbi:MAG: hypothetical protein MK089_03915 [Phycisphaerales bacterium]|nr:hypothetical protein [Phycisphaerales bacterium]
MQDAYPRQTVRRYGLMLMSLIAILIGGTVVLQALTDPILAYETGLARFDDMRHLSLRSAKSEILSREKFDTVILGSSRGESGFAPDDEMWGDDRVYNAALAGSNIYEMRLVWELLKRSHRPKRLIIETSLLNFTNAKTTFPDFNLSRLKATQRWADGDDQTLLDYLLLKTPPGSVSLESRFNWVLGWPYVRKALGTLMRGIRGTRSMRYFGEDGFGIRDDEVPDNKALIEAALVTNNLIDPTYYNGFELGEDRLLWLDQIVSEAAAEGIEVDIILPPIHAVQMEALDRMGLMQQYDQLRKFVTELAATHAPDVQAWDFSGFDGPVNETVTDAKNSPMKNYFDGSHFTPALGHLVLKRLYGGEDDQKMLRQMGGFGVQLLPAGVTPYLQRWHEAHKAWQENHPHYMAWVDGMMEKSQAERDRQLEISRKLRNTRQTTGFLP